MGLQAIKIEQGSAALEILKQMKDLGYVHNFKLQDKALVCLETGTKYQASDLAVEATFRFEGESNPDDSSVLYVLKATDGVGGTLMEPFGAKSSAGLADILSRTVDHRVKSRFMQNVPAYKTILIRVDQKKV